MGIAAPRQASAQGFLASALSNDSFSRYPQSTSRANQLTQYFRTVRFSLRANLRGKTEGKFATVVDDVAGAEGKGSCQMSETGRGRTPAILRGCQIWSSRGRRQKSCCSCGREGKMLHIIWQRGSVTGNDLVEKGRLEKDIQMDV